MELGVFLERLVPLRNLETGEAAVLKVLDMFEKNLVARMFEGLPLGQSVSSFSEIFRVLFNCSMHESATVRLEVARAMSVFLSRMLPFYCDRMQEAFAKALQRLKNRTPLMVAAFTMISQHIAAPLLLQFLKLSPILEWLVVDDGVYVAIIEKMSALGNAFLVELMNHLIGQFRKDPNRHIIKAIGTVVKHSPTLLFPMIADIRSLPLMAYVCTNANIERVPFDWSSVIQYAFEVLSKPESSPIDVDNSLQILSGLSQFLETRVADIGDGKLELTIGGQVLPLMCEKLRQRPAFFLLPIPVSLLTPNDGDSVLILTSKFRSLARAMNDENMGEILRIFEPYLTANYDERCSSAMIGFAMCVHKVKDPILVNRVIFRDPTNWFHAFDIVRVVKNLPITMSLVDVLHRCLLMKSEDLTRASIQALKESTTDESFPVVASYFNRHIDPYDVNNLVAVLSALKELTTTQTRQQTGSVLLRPVIQSVIECLELHSHDLNVLACLYGFLSRFHLTFIEEEKLSKMGEAALNIIEFYWISFFGQEKKTKETEADELLVLIRKEVQDTSFDILNQFKDYHSFLPCFGSAVAFFYSLPLRVIGSQQALDVVDKMFTFFPEDSTEFLEANWHRFKDTERVPVLSEIFNKLQFVNDPEVMAAWCRIAMSTASLVRDKRMEQVVGFLHVECATYLDTAPKSMKTAEVFCRFLIRTMPSGRDYVAKFMATLNENQLAELASYADKNEYGELIPNPVEALAKPTEKPAIEPQQVKAPTNAKEFREALANAVLSGDIQEMQRIFVWAQEKKWKVNMKDYEFPVFMREFIMKRGKRSMDAKEALSFSRTMWGRVARARIEKAHNEVITSLLNTQKVKRRALLDLMAIVSVKTSTFDTQKLLQLAYQASLASETTQRLRVTVLLLAVILRDIKRLDDKIVRAFINNMNQKFSVLPHRELSICLREMHTSITVDAPFLYFCWKLLAESSRNSSEYAILCRILKKNMDILLKANKKTALDFESIVHHLLKSTQPSLYMGGLRILTLGPVRHTLDYVVGGLETFRHSPIINALIVSVVTINDWRERFAKLESCLTMSPSQPEFYTFMPIFGYITRSLPLTNHLCASTVRLVETLLESATDYNQFIQMTGILKSILKQLPSEKREVQSMAYFEKFVSSIKTESYYTFFYIREMAALASSEANQQKVFETLCSKAHTVPVRFSVMFAVLAHESTKVTNKEWRNIQLSKVIDSTTNPQQKRAIECLQNDSIKEAVEDAKHL